MIAPPALKPGDKVAIVATARKVSKLEIEPAIDIVKSWELEVILGKNLFKQYNQFAGTDNERKADMQNALDDKSIKAILFARGGYGTMRIMDELILSKFITNPKWLIGFSDITPLHLIANKHNIESIHAPMAFNFSKTPQNILNSLKNILFGNPVKYSVKNFKLNRAGQVKGVLIGGNLSMLYATQAQLLKSKFLNPVLFIEDLDEYLYHIDRMMLSLKHAGVLKMITGLVVGGMNDMRDNTKEFGFKTDNPFGKTANEIISESVAEFNFPVCFNFPAGHIENNHPLILGREVVLNVANKVTLTF